MATITAKGSLFDTNTGTHTVTATPVLNDFIVIVCANSATTTDPTVTDNNADGLGTYTKVVDANKDTNTDKVFIFVRNSAIGSATSTIFSVTGASSTGGGLTVYAIAGALAYGTAGVKQVAKSENQSTGTPTLTMPTYNMGLNPVISAVFNDTNVAGVTASTGYTRDYNLGFATPTTGLAVESLSYTTAPATKTLAWGGASASNYAAVAVEIYISVMSVNTSTANWSVLGTWDYGVPTDGQIVLIDAPSTVSFDVDQSGFSIGLAGLTINGTLNNTSSSGSHTLKIKATVSVTGTGTWNFGSTTFAGKNILTAASGNVGVNCAAGLAINVYGAEPTYKYVKLTQASAANATRFYVDTNLIGDIWSPGDTIHINNINKAVQSDSAVIAAIASTYIDVVTGFTNTKLLGSLVVLVTRNTLIVQGTITSYLSGKLIIAGGQWTSPSGASIFTTGAGLTISGGEFTGLVIYSATGTNTITDGVFSACSSNGAININGASGKCIVTGGLFTACSPLFGILSSLLISGGDFYGNGIVIGTYNGTEQTAPGVTITGGNFYYNTTVVYIMLGVCILGGTFYGNSKVIYKCSIIMLNGVTFTNNTNDIVNSEGLLFNQILTSSPDNLSYGLGSLEFYLESINAGGVGGALKAWTSGGITTSVASPVPTGFSRSYQMSPESASVLCWWRKQILVPAGKSVTITTYLYKTVTMTYLPRAWIYLDGNQPLDVAGSILHTFTMTDSTTTWESDAYVYTNSGNYDIMVDVMFVAENASGYVNTQVKADFGGGGGSVSIGPSKLAMIG